MFPEVACAFGRLMVPFEGMDAWCIAPKGSKKIHAAVLVFGSVLIFWGAPCAGPCAETPPPWGGGAKKRPVSRQPAVAPALLQTLCMS